MGSMKPAGLSVLFISFLVHIADSHPSRVTPNTDCEDCTLQQNIRFLLEHPIYQCMGCCFSRAYPTPLMSKRTMVIPKNITSEASCCVAMDSYEIEVAGIRMKNHTSCHCSTCLFHKQ